MEEDTGKSLHVGGATGRIHGAEYSLLDYNRAGVPLIEIVTKMIPGTRERAPEVARAYVTALRDLLRALGVSDVRMDQGSLRCDANLSLSPRGSGVLGTRTETKNVNSLRSVERAVRYEMTPAGRRAAGGREGRPGDPALRRGHRAPPAPAVARRPPRTTATSRSRTSCRSRRPRSGWRSCAPRCPSCPWERRGGSRPSGAHRRGAARPGQRGRARPDRGHRRRRRPAGRGPVVVGVLPRPAGQHPRRRARSACRSPRRRWRG